MPLLRRLRTLLIVLLAAVAGGVAAVGVGEWSGWLGSAEQAGLLATSAPAVANPAPEPAAAVISAGKASDAAAIYRLRSPGAVTISATFAADGPTAQGSGFVVSSDGTMLTSAHVITDAGAGEIATAVRAAAPVYVEFGDDDRVPARIVGRDVFSDAGVLRVDPGLHALVSVPLGRSAAVGVGDPVAAIGSPFGNEGSLSVGVVSATRPRSNR